MHDKRVRALLLALLVAVSTTTLAQTYPSKPVRFVVPFPAGALPDQIARAMAPQLQEALGQPFVIENKPGAIGTIGTAEAARAAPDGHTIVMTTNSTLAAAGALYKKLQYDPLKDFAPIMLISKTSMILLVRPDFPAQTLKDFLALARAKSGQLTGGYGSAGSQVSIAKLKAGGGFAAVDVPYKGVPPAVTDLLANQIGYTFADFAVALGHIRGGKLRGLGAPAGTPREAVNRIYESAATAMAKPEFKARFAAFGVDPAPMGPGEFGDYIRKEIDKWSRDIKQAGIEPE